MNPYFESRADDYSRRSQSGIWRYIRNLELAAILDSLEVCPGQTIIDIGCGAGFYSVALRDLGLDVFAIDSSPGMIHATRKAGIRSSVANIEEFQTKDTFDLALAAGVLEFMKNPKVLFRNTRRFLNDEGILVVLVPVSGFRGALYRTFHEINNCKTWARTTEEYQTMAFGEGFQLCQIKKCTPISVAMKFRKRF